MIVLYTFCAWWTITACAPEWTGIAIEWAQIKGCETCWANIARGTCLTVWHFTLNTLSLVNTKVDVRCWAACSTALRIWALDAVWTTWDAPWYIKVKVGRAAHAVRLICTCRAA
jgi:hypothetical protein